MNAFHETKKSAAVLKHGIIDAYASPFIGKTGSRSLNNRVAIIDGYAGPGRYGDDEEGSGAMLLRHARDLAYLPRRVELHFVEQDPETLSRLQEVVAAEGDGVAVTVSDGDVSARLPELLSSCEGIPTFVYLDPCGLVIPFSEVVGIFARPGHYGAPATEVLINFSAVSLRRFAGHLTSEKGSEATLARMDDVCGGDWWRQAWLNELPDRDAAEEAVAHGYAAKLAQDAGTGYWVVDVRPRPKLKPLYYLVFATRHRDGLAVFGEASSLGLSKWRRHHAENAVANTLFGQDDTWKDDFKAAEAQLGAKWSAAIAERLAAELAKGEAFCVADRYAEVYGDLVGIARRTHLLTALKKVYDDGLTTTSPVGANDKLLSRVFTPA